MSKFWMGLAAGERLVTSAAALFPSTARLTRTDATMNAVVFLALRQRVLVNVVACWLVSWVAGVVLFTKLNIEAYPDPVPPSVEVVTQSSGLSAEEIERNISILIEVQMAGILHVTAIRTISLFGLSDVQDPVLIRLHL